MTVFHECEMCLCSSCIAITSCHVLQGVLFHCCSDVYVWLMHVVCILYVFALPLSISMYFICIFANVENVIMFSLMFV